MLKVARCRHGSMQLLQLLAMLNPDVNLKVSPLTHTPSFIECTPYVSDVSAALH